MTKEAKDLLHKINAKKDEIKNLLAEDKLDDAEALKAGLDTMQRKLDILLDLEDEGKQNAFDGALDGNAKTVEGGTVKPTAKECAVAFVNAFVAKIRGGQPSEKDRAILDQMSEGSDADGGLTVPQDIQTTIKELRRSGDDLETHVNIETTTVNKGSRIIEEDADSTPWEEVDEAGDFPDAATPKVKKIDYLIKKYGGILKLTRELIQDTAENILAFLTKYIAKKSKATRNAKIIAAFDSITTGQEVTINDIDALKDVFNVELDPAIALSSEIIMNQDAFNELDKMKDSDGKYIIQPCVTDATKLLLFGKYPVTVLSNKTLKTDAEKGAPVYMGDGKEAVTLFDRENMTIETNDNVFWKNDITACKVRDRFDVQAVDKNAIVKGFVPVTAG